MIDQREARRFLDGHLSVKNMDSGSTKFLKQEHGNYYYQLVFSNCAVALFVVDGETGRITGTEPDIIEERVDELQALRLNGKIQKLDDGSIWTDEHVQYHVDGVE